MPRNELSQKPGSYSQCLPVSPSPHSIHHQFWMILFQIPSPSHPVISSSTVNSHWIPANCTPWSLNFHSCLQSPDHSAPNTVAVNSTSNQESPISDLYNGQPFTGTSQFPRWSMAVSSMTPAVASSPATLYLPLPPMTSHFSLQTWSETFHFSLA